MERSKNKQKNKNKKRKIYCYTFDTKLRKTYTKVSHTRAMQVWSYESTSVYNQSKEQSGEKK